MPLKTVRVPPEFTDLFEKAERTVARYFAARRDDPEHGTIEIFDERYVLVRAASLSVEFFAVVRELFGAGREDEAADFARNILFDLAHALGKSDAHRFAKRMKVDDPIARLASGPVHFAHSGWAFVDLHPESRPVADESFYLRYDHPYSFESQAWMEAGEETRFPVCIMNAGYSAGWCEGSFGVHLVASELLCRARGDEVCRFVMGHPDRIEEFVRGYAKTDPIRGRQIESYQIPDFFARKRIEEELREARDELERRVHERTAELRKAYDRIRREMMAREDVERELIRTHKMEALGRMAGGIAHDFNNLMTVVIGQAEVLEQQLGERDGARAQLAAIREAGTRASAIARQLLAFGRSHVLQAERIDLNRFVIDALELLKRAVGEDLELATRLDAGPCGVVLDRSEFTQVLLNLVLNARDAACGRGTVRIETDTVAVSGDSSRAPAQLAPGRWVRLSVIDDGAGMDAETLEKAFDPYFTTKGEGKGTGLGLSTVYGIVKNSGGSILVSSPETGGARFDVYLPLAEGTDERETRSETTDRLPAGTETILVVEDQAAPRALVVRILRDLGYRVLEADTPVRALELAGDPGNGIDLLLTDVIMPQMSGTDLAHRLVSHGPIGRCLYMSGYADDTALGHEFETEGVELLAKPFSRAGLAQAVRRVLDADRVGEG